MLSTREPRVLCLSRPRAVLRGPPPWMPSVGPLPLHPSRPVWPKLATGASLPATDVFGGSSQGGAEARGVNCESGAPTPPRRPQRCCVEPTRKAMRAHGSTGGLRMRRHGAPAPPGERRPRGLATGQEGGPVELRPVPSGGCHRREGLRAERARVHVVMRGIVDGREAPETLTESTGQVTRLSGGGAPRAGPTASLHGDSSARVKAGGLAEKPRALRAGAALLAPRMSSGSRGRLRKLLWGTPPSRSCVDRGEAPRGVTVLGGRGGTGESHRRLLASQRSESAGPRQTWRPGRGGSQSQPCGPTVRRHGGDRPTAPR